MNRDSFEDTALPHMPVLRTFALHLTRDSENANDLLQDTYLKAYRFWDHFEQGSNIKAWLCRIMKNSYINWYRKGRTGPTRVRYDEYQLPVDALEGISSTPDPLPDHGYDNVFGDEIVRSFESIKDTFREVIVLADVEGLSYEEIASTVDCPIGTVRSRLHRGRKLLKKKLRTYARQYGYVRNTSRA